MMGDKKKKSSEMTEKVLDVNAAMQGTLSFKDPVNLKINGKFDGTLDTKGTLTIGENAVVNAEIEGDEIYVEGKVKGNIFAHKSLFMGPSSEVNGSIKTPILSVEQGAILQGDVQMFLEGSANEMDLEDVAKYLEVEKNLVEEWARQGKIPSQKIGNDWRFEKQAIDQWVAKEKIK